jgi:hypothetical protein
VYCAPYDAYAVMQRVNYLKALANAKMLNENIIVDFVDLQDAVEHVFGADHMHAATVCFIRACVLLLFIYLGATFVCACVEGAKTT